MTITEIKAELDRLGVEYPSGRALHSEWEQRLTDAVLITGAEAIQPGTTTNGATSYYSTSRVDFCWIADHALGPAGYGAYAPATVVSWTERPPARSPGGGGQWERVVGSNIPYWATLARG